MHEYGKFFGIDNSQKDACFLTYERSLLSLYNGFNLLLGGTKLNNIPELWGSTFILVRLLMMSLLTALIIRPLS